MADALCTAGKMRAWNTTTSEKMTDMCQKTAEPRALALLTVLPTRLRLVMSDDANASLRIAIFFVDVASATAVSPVLISGSAA